MVAIDFAVTLTDVLGGAVHPHAFARDSLERAVAAALPGGASMLHGLHVQNGEGDAQPPLVVQSIADGAAAMHSLRSAVLSGEFGLGLGRALNAEPRLDAARLEPGAPVRLGGLKQKPGLNGSQAVLVAPSKFRTEDGARWTVRVGAEVLSIKATCLLPAAVAAAADASEFAAQHEAAALSLEALTPHQQHALEECGDDEHAHLMAPAGAGKTFVALHQVLRLLTSRPDAVALFVARNAALATFAAAWLGTRAGRGGPAARRRLLARLHGGRQPPLGACGPLKLDVQGAELP